ncbi:MBL fold metallo-hydrolase [Candidatus Kaiserbacteria bacterium]|nr:MBL fold metallo-hydrolase [Candidatus Kaiserbacteria bacterium]
MVITHHGGQCFKVTFGDLTLAFDPIAKGASLPAVRFGADIALVSRNHPDMNGVEEVAYGDKKPFAITGPGEYERQGVTIQGFLSASKYPASPKNPQDNSFINTIYSVELEDMTLVHLGALSSTELSKEAREGLGEIDVLFVPVGGNGVLSSEEAHKLVVALEPRVIIPMHWSLPAGRQAAGEQTLADFIKKSGNGSEKVDKLTLKKRDVSSREGSIIVVTP